MDLTQILSGFPCVYYKSIIKFYKDTPYPPQIKLHQIPVILSHE